MDTLGRAIKAATTQVRPTEVVQFGGRVGLPDPPEAMLIGVADHLARLLAEQDIKRRARPSPPHSFRRDRDP